jgi:hypothetical protein
MSCRDAAALVAAAREDLPAGGAERAYELWRARIRSAAAEARGARAGSVRGRA